MILCTRSNSPSREESRSKARGLNFTLIPWAILSEPTLRKFVLFPCGEMKEKQNNYRKL